MLFRAVAVGLAASALARIVLAALLCTRESARPELCIAVAVGLIVWAVYDVVAAWALLTRELAGRMLGFISASVQAVLALLIVELTHDKRWFGIMAVSVAMAALLAIAPSSDDPR